MSRSLESLMRERHPDTPRADAIINTVFFLIALAAAFGFCAIIIGA